MPAFAIDAVFAYAHFIGIGLLIVCLAMETALLRTDAFTPALFARLTRIDRNYGLSAALIIAAGIGRVNFGVKDAAFYTHNHVFWTKMVLFAAAGLASVLPTIAYLRWKKASADDPAFQPPARKLRSVRGHIFAQWVLFALVPVAAVLMARGVGLEP